MQQMIQRRETAAEIVDGHAHLAIGKTLQDADRGIGSLVEGVLGNLKHEARRIGTAGRKGFHHLGDQIGVKNLPARKVDGHEQIRVRQGFAPRTQLPANGVKHLLRQRDGKTPVLGQCEQAVNILNGSIGAAQAQ